MNERAQPGTEPVCYEAAEILSTFPPVEQKPAAPSPTSKWTETRSSDRGLDRFTDPDGPLTAIPPDGYDEWITIGAALHHESGGSAEGLAIWEEWSRQASNFVEGDCGYRWSGFRAGRGATGGTIYHLAEQHGWRKRERPIGQLPRRNGPLTTDGNNVLQMDFTPPKQEYPTEVDGGDDRPEIRCSQSWLHKTTDRAEKILLKAEVPFYQRAGMLMRPVQDTLCDSLGREAEFATLHQVDKVYLRDVLTRNIRFMTAKTSKDGVEWVPIDAPVYVADTMLARNGEWMFPSIGGVISTPTLRPDGSILAQPGYDEKTRLYLMPGALQVPGIATKPTRADAQAKLELLKDLLCEFSFADTESKSVALSALITLTCRGAMDVVPAHVLRAFAAGSGKTYLADIASAIATGSPCPVMAAGRTEEETEKRIGSKALAGTPIIAIDNVNGPIGGDNLCQIISQPLCEIRVLGQSKMPTVVNRFSVIITGNGVTLIGDLTRRCLLCTIDAKVEKPAEREFKRNPVADVLADRGRYVAACLTIVRAYILAGRPKQGGKPMNSFNAWANSVRDALMWLGCADPVLTVEAARQEDPELQLLSQFIAAFREEIGVGKAVRFTAKAIANKAAERRRSADDPSFFGDPGPADGNLAHPMLNAVLEEWRVKGEVNTKAFGRWLLRSRGRVVGGHRIASEPNTTTNTMDWFLEEMVRDPDHAA
jgi:putative DNA primase/helicase